MGNTLDGLRFAPVSAKRGSTINKSHGLLRAPGSPAILPVFALFSLPLAVFVLIRVSVSKA